MAQRKHRLTWDAIPYLDADCMAGWSAFEPGPTETVDFDDGETPEITIVVQPDRPRFTATCTRPGGLRDTGRTGSPNARNSTTGCEAPAGARDSGGRNPQANRSPA